MATATERGSLVRSAVGAAGGLLNQQEVAWLIGRNKSSTNFIVDTEDFPKPIWNVGHRTRVWLKEEVEKWMAKHPKQGTRLAGADDSGAGAAGSRAAVG